MASIISRKNLYIIIGPTLALTIYFCFELEPGNRAVSATAAIALWMAFWWITEAVPLAVTSLLPVVLFPAFGVMNGRTVSSTYFNHVIFLFIGGFIIALAMQKWNVHKRIALKILLVTGASAGRILFGFMLATAFLSMWISNTATAMMMIPILMSIIGELRENLPEKSVNRFSIALLLGVAYSASIGGMATLVGTPPNLSFARIFQIYFPTAPEITFAQWFFFALPISALFFFMVWLYLYLLFRPKNKKAWSSFDRSVLQRQYLKLGKTSIAEKQILIIFAATAILWLFRSKLNFGAFSIPGWSELFPDPTFINDGTVAIASAILLFALPSRQGKAKLMDWSTARQLPWRIVLLFGGGFALAAGFKESGLSLWFGEQLDWIGDTNPIIVIFAIALMTTFLTELTSNTATTEMLLPILAGLAITTETNPLLFMIPATLSASMAFMLPVATPPNAIVFGTGQLSIAQMARNGFVLNVLGAIIITLMTWWLETYVFSIELQTFPEWANIAGK